MPQAHKILKCVVYAFKDLLFCFYTYLFLYKFSSNSFLFSDAHFGINNKYHNYTNVHFLEGIFMDVMTKVFCNDASNKCFTRAYRTYSRLSLSRSRRDPLKHFEISVLRHIRCAELGKIPNKQPNFTNEHVI